MRRVTLCLLLLLLAVLPAALILGGQDSGTTGARQEDGLSARQIVDGDTLVLDDERQVRLVGIQAPKLPLGRPNFPTWPLAAEAKAALGALALGRQLKLVYTGRHADRHGRQLAHIYTAGAAGAAGAAEATGAEGGEVWVQGALLEQGMARVYSFPDNRALVPEMLSRERAARAARRGIWDHPFYAVRTDLESEEDIGTFQLIEGEVIEVAVVRGRAYLNFGDDWKQDFTITLAPAVRRLFETEGHDPRAYEGRRVRVRGWLKSFNGPMIEATHPEQIELLD